MTWGMLLREGRKMLMPAFPDESEREAGQEARLLLSWASGQSTAWLLARLNDTMTTDDHVAADRFRAALSRRARREPVAYVVGQAGFCGHLFEVNPSVLIPRPDTELLVETVTAFLRNRDMGLFTRILEIGTGSGCIACSLALNHENASITAVDLSAEALCVANRNADRLGVSGQIRFLREDVLACNSSSLLNSNPAEQNPQTGAPQSNSTTGPSGAAPEQNPQTGAPQSSSTTGLSGAATQRNALYDVLVSNPPYIPTADMPGLMPDVLQYEPHVALDGGADGLLFFRRLLRISKDLLKCGGLLAVEIGHDQGAAVPDLFRKEGFNPTVYFDLGGNPRVVTGIFNGPLPPENK